MKNILHTIKSKIGDHKFSLNPAELEDGSKCKICEKNKVAKRTISSNEKNYSFLQEKHLLKDKLKGEKIKYSDLIILRLQGYLSVDKLNFIKNKTLIKDVKSYSPLKINYFK